MVDVWQKTMAAAIGEEQDFGAVRSLTLDGVQRPSPKWGMLANFQNLEHLSLANTRVGSLDGFPSFKKLTKLVLSDNHITGGLEALQGLDVLQYLDLSNNWIQYIDVLKPLEAMKLVSLDLYKCPVTRVVDYRARVFRMIASLKYLDKTDLELKEMPESDEEEDDDEDEEGDPGSGEVDGEREYACNGHVDEFERVGEEEDDVCHIFRHEIDGEDGEDDGVEDELDDSEDEDDAGDDDNYDNGEDEEDEEEEVDNVNVEGGVLKLETAKKLNLEGGEIDGHEQGEDDEDGDGEFDDDDGGGEEEDEEDSGAGYLVQPVGHEEIHDGEEEEEEEVDFEGEEEEVDFEGDAEVENEEREQKSAASSGTLLKRKRNTETDGEEEEDLSFVDVARAAKRP